MQSVQPTSADFLYFSFITQLMVGFGDLTAAGNVATVAKGEDVALTGFAEVSKVKRPARTARNPATGEAVRVKAKTVAKITP